MLDRLRNFFDLGGRTPEEAFALDDERTATAALMVHLLAIDGEFTAEERDRMSAVLAREYALSPAETEKLVAVARQRDREAVDLYGFTSVLKRKLDEEGRRRIVLLLWEMVFADGAVHEFEENMLWRVAELLGISSRDRLFLKRHVAGEAGAE